MKLQLFKNSLLCFVSVVTILGFLFLSESLKAFAQTTTSVKEVISGDTIVVQDGRIIRLIGIVAPRLQSKNSSAEFYAEESRKTLESLLTGRSIDLWLENQNASYKHKDKYGRLLAYVCILPQQVIANREMLRTGAAYLYTSHFNKILNDMQSDQYKARKNKKGLWVQVSESPGEIAQHNGIKYEELPFVLEQKPISDESKEIVKVSSNDKPSKFNENAKIVKVQSEEDLIPVLDPKISYGNYKVQTCAVLNVSELGNLSLIGVRNQVGPEGNAAKLEVEKLLHGKKLKFVLDEFNRVRKHRDKNNNLLVYAFLPNGSLLNLQIVAKGISDADYEWDFNRKSEILSARDVARIKGEGIQWKVDVIEAMDPEKLRTSIAEATNTALGQVGGKVELIGENHEVLRISHDIMDQQIAKNIFKAISVSRDTNLQALRASGVKEIQFTNMNISSIIRFHL